MVTLDRASNDIALIMGGSIGILDVIRIGDGSGTENSAQSGLLAELTFAGVSRPSSFATNKFTLVANFSAPVMSGINLRELGAGVDGTEVLVNRDAFPC